MSPERVPPDSEVVSEEVPLAARLLGASREGVQGHRVSPELTLSVPRIVRGTARPFVCCGADEAPTAGQLNAVVNRLTRGRG